MATPQTQRSFTDVLQDIVSNIQQIIRAEVRLAQVEIKEKANRASKPLSVLVTGAVLGLYGLGFLLLAAVYGLSLVLPTWGAALIVGAVIAIIGGGLVASGLTKLREINPVPEKTVQTMKETAQWAKEQTK
jgi:uncharacterized membrane protein YqjE